MITYTIFFSAAGVTVELDVRVNYELDATEREQLGEAIVGGMSSKVYFMYCEKKDYE